MELWAQTVSSEAWEDLKLVSDLPSTPRAGTTMGHIPGTGYILMYGGETIGGARLGDVWRFEPGRPQSQQWTQLQDGNGWGAGKRKGHAWTWHRHLAAFVVLGGENDDSALFQYSGCCWAKSLKMWKLNGHGTSWQPLNGPSTPSSLRPSEDEPPRQAQHLTVVEIESDNLVGNVPGDSDMLVYGGFPFTQWLYQLTWTGWWQRLLPIWDVERRYGHSAVYAQELEAMVVFGGMGESGRILNDLWYYAPRGNFVAVINPQLPDGPPPAMVYHKAVWTGREMIVTAPNITTTWVWSDMGDRISSHGTWRAFPNGANGPGYGQASGPTAAAWDPNSQKTFVGFRDREAVPEFWSFDASKA